MSDTTQIILAVISGIVLLGSLQLRLGFTQRKRDNVAASRWNEVQGKVETLTTDVGTLTTSVEKLGHSVDQFDIVLSGYRGIGGLLVEVERLKERDGSGDQRIRDGAKHGANNAIAPVVIAIEQLKEELGEKLEDHELRLRVLERVKP